MLEDITQGIASKYPPEGFPIKVVAIDGHGGSGKSTLAKKLAQELNATILEIDDFGPIKTNQARLIAILEIIKSGAQTLSYERHSWWPDHRPEAMEDQPVTSIMILEGVGSARKEFRKYLTYTIWVETPLEVCMQRGLERDGEEARKQWEMWLAEEDAYIARDNPQKYADIILSGNNQ